MSATRIARNVTLVLGALTVAVLAVGLLSGDMGVFSVSLFFAVFGLCLTIGSAIAWLIIFAKSFAHAALEEVAKSGPTSNSAVENGRADEPRAVHRER